MATNRVFSPAIRKSSSDEARRRRSAQLRAEAARRPVTSGQVRPKTTVKRVPVIKDGKTVGTEIREVSTDSGRAPIQRFLSRNQKISLQEDLRKSAAAAGASPKFAPKRKGGGNVPLPGGRQIQDRKEELRILPDDPEAPTNLRRAITVPRTNRAENEARRIFGADLKAVQSNAMKAREKFIADENLGSRPFSFRSKGHARGFEKIGFSDDPVIRKAQETLAGDGIFGHVTDVERRKLDETIKNRQEFLWLSSPEGQAFEEERQRLEEQAASPERTAAIKELTLERARLGTTSDEGRPRPRIEFEDASREFREGFEDDLTRKRLQEDKDRADQRLRENQQDSEDAINSQFRPDLITGELTAGDKKRRDKLLATERRKFKRIQEDLNRDFNRGIEDLDIRVQEALDKESGAGMTDAQRIAAQKAAEKAAFIDEYLERNPDASTQYAENLWNAQQKYEGGSATKEAIGAEFNAWMASPDADRGKALEKAAELNDFDLLEAKKLLQSRGFGASDIKSQEQAYRKDVLGYSDEELQREEKARSVSQRIELALAGKLDEFETANLIDQLSVTNLEQAQRLALMIANPDMTPAELNATMKARAKAARADGTPKSKKQRIQEVQNVIELKLSSGAISPKEVELEAFKMGLTTSQVTAMKRALTTFNPSEQETTSNIKEANYLSAFRAAEAAGKDLDLSQLATVPSNDPVVKAFESLNTIEEKAGFLAEVERQDQAVAEALTFALFQEDIVEGLEDGGGGVESVGEVATFNGKTKTVDEWLETENYNTLTGEQQDQLINSLE